MSENGRRAFLWDEERSHRYRIGGPTVIVARYGPFASEVPTASRPSGSAVSGALELPAQTQVWAGSFRTPAMSFTGKLSVLFALVLNQAATAQEGYLGEGHDKWHRSFYQDLQRPDTKAPCCNLTDCRPTSGRQVDDHYEVKVNGAWVSVPPDKILKQPAPDLGFHVCAPFKFDGQPSHLYCVVVPPEI